MNEEIKTENVPVGIVTMLSEQQQQLLQTANQSLEQYAQEEKAKQRNLERQRNIAYVIAVCMLCVAVR